MNIDSLSVFFPAYNEEKNISSTIRSALKVLKDSEVKNFEIMVVDDGSSDNTSAVVQGLIKQDSHIKLVSHEKNRGYGGALKTGFEAAKYPWVTFTDADGQFDFREIRKLMAAADNADLVLGYRLKRADSLMRVIFTFGWALMARVLLGLSARDYSCAFKLIKKKVYESVSPLITEEKVTQIELMVKAKRHGFKFAEVGVHHYPRKFGQQTGANLKIVLKSVADLFGLWWKIR